MREQRRRRRVAVQAQSLGRVVRRAPHRVSPALLALFLLPILALAVIAWAIVANLHRSSSLAVQRSQTPPDHAVIFIVLGMKPEWISQGLTPNLVALQRAGVSFSNAWVGQAPALAPISAASISTGFVPRRTGLIAASWRDPHTGIVVTPFAPESVALGSVDEVLRTHVISDFPAMLRERYPGAHILSIGGAGCAAASAAGTWLATYVVCPRRSGSVWSASHVLGHSLPAGTLAALGLPKVRERGDGWPWGAEDAWIAQATVLALRRVHPRLLLVTLPELNLLERTAHVQHRGEVQRVILRGLDSDVAHIIAEVTREGLYDRTVFVLAGASGAQPVHHHIALSALEATIFAAGGQRLYLNGAGLTEFALRDSLQIDPVVRSLHRHFTGIAAVFVKVKQRTGWAYRARYHDPSWSAAYVRAVRFLLHTSLRAASPQIILLYRNGTAVGGGSAAGDALTWQAQHIPLIVSGRGFWRDKRVSDPARLVDIAPTLESVMHLGRAQGDGVILAKALPQPSGTAVQAERTNDGRLNPILAALKLGK